MNGKYPISHIGRLRMGIDGKGIRTLVLFQRCPLRCKYCINQFTWNDNDKTKMMSAQELYDNILIDRPYLLATNGGITFGGGEPLLQSECIKEFAECNKENFSIYLETSLNVPLSYIERVIDVVDMYYVDIKTTDYNVYKNYTGGDLQIVLDNLKYLLAKVGKEKIVVRIPTVPGFADKEAQRKSKAFLGSMGIKYFDLFDYRVV